VYQASFTEVVRQCEQAGLVRGDTLYLDSTLVRADAALSSLGSRVLTARLASAKAGDHVAALWQDNPNDGAAAEATAPPRCPRSSSSRWSGLGRIRSARRTCRMGCPDAPTNWP
jgi:hypothetical protein